MKPELSSKLPHVGTSIFATMSALAAEHKAINLSQGFPDFAVPTPLLDAVTKHLKLGHNQYAPMPGVLALREAIARKVRAAYGVEVDPVHEITVTSGGTEALFDAIACAVQPGDEVIVFDPSYDSYEPAIRMQGARAIRIPLQTPHFSIDWNRVSDALSPRTRMVLINSPHNPTGSVLSPTDLDTLAQLLETSAAVVLSDEVYEHIIFDGHKHATVLTHPKLRHRSFAVYSFGKTYHATGWKMGYCIAPQEMTREFRKVHQFVTFCSNTPMQHALADFMTDHPNHWTALPQFFEERRNKFCSSLEGSAFRLTPASGTYFQLADYGAISDLDDLAFARKLTIEHGVATIPISVFYETPPDTRLVRFCFAKDDATIEGAARILQGLRNV